MNVEQVAIDDLSAEIFQELRPVVFAMRERPDRVALFEELPGGSATGGAGRPGDEDHGCRHRLPSFERCSLPGDFFEMAEAQGLDYLCLDRRDVLVGLVGAKRRANDGAGSAATLGLTYELGDGLCDVMRIRGVLALEHRDEGLEQGVGDLADLAICLRDFDTGGCMNAGE